MPPIPTPRTSSSFLFALTQEIEKKLRRALTSPSQRRNLLEELFADIALEIDDRARDILLGRQDLITLSEDGTEGRLCFYDVLADYFVWEPENGNPILDLIVQLWSQSFVSHIFSLLFHKWLFEVQLEKSEDLLRYSSALVQGATNVFCGFEPLISEGAAAPAIGSLNSRFLHGGNNVSLFTWNKISFCKVGSIGKSMETFLEIFPIQFESSTKYEIKVFRIDIQTSTMRFQTLFQYLLEEVALVSKRLKRIPLQAQRELFLLLSRFMLFYNSADKLESFLNQFPDFPATFLVGGPADIFVIELTDQLHKLKVEPVLLHYLSQLTVLQGLELRMTTSTRLKTCLYSFTSPGGPMYPTRVVRHAAWDALDFLFPVGRFPRHLISLSFRLLYPWYWPSSCWNFIVSCMQAALHSILSFIFSVWDRLANA